MNVPCRICPETNPIPMNWICGFSDWRVIRWMVAWSKSTAPRRPGQPRAGRPAGRWSDRPWNSACWNREIAGRAQPAASAPVREAAEGAFGRSPDGNQTVPMTPPHVPAEQPAGAASPPTGVGLDGLRDAARGCRACPLWEPATQAVFGAGPEDARVMLVGEQPGDVEDRRGEPFVGPAGRLLDRALADA